MAELFAEQVMEQKGVVLLHGIFRTGKSMRFLEKYLNRHGFQTLNITFQSTKLPIEEVVEFIHPMIDEFAKRINGPVSFVTYSLGGLVTRAYLKKYQLSDMGRVVMLGPPNKGSGLADRMKNWWLYKKYFGPAGQQLVTDQSAFADLFGEVNYELGVIAGNWTVTPISSLFMEWPNDGKVSVANTKLDGMKDHVIVPVAHSFLPVSLRARRHVLNFLTQGYFVKRSGNK